MVSPEPERGRVKWLALYKKGKGKGLALYTKGEGLKVPCSY